MAIFFSLAFHFVFRRFIFLKWFNWCFFAICLVRVCVCAFFVCSLLSTVWNLFIPARFYIIYYSLVHLVHSHTHTRVHSTLERSKKISNGKNKLESHKKATTATLTAIIISAKRTENETVARLSRLNTLFEFTNKKKLFKLMNMTICIGKNQQKFHGTRRIYFCFRLIRFIHSFINCPAVYRFRIIQTEKNRANKCEGKKCWWEKRINKNPKCNNATEPNEIELKPNGCCSCCYFVEWER